MPWIRGMAVVAACLLLGACSSASHDSSPAAVGSTTTTGGTTGDPATTVLEAPGPGTGGLRTPATLPDGNFPPTDEPRRSGTLAKVPVKLTEVARIAAPTVLVARPGHPDQLFIAERAGKVLLAHPAAGATPFRVDTAHPLLDLSDVVSTAGEEGLLGLAFDRSGTTLYVSYDIASNDSRIVSYPIGGTSEAPTIVRRQRTLVLAVDQPDETNHKGGELQLGPDGDLYVGLGDGGNEGDPNDIGQNPHTLLSKILRIDLTHASVGRPETFISGVRNPWRFTFDTGTGDLWIGDVGQNAVEEVDRIPAGKGAGANLGWSGYEGTRVFEASRRPVRSVPPLYELLHDTGACALTGGWVYRGHAIPSLVGAYVFADFCLRGLAALRSDGSRTSQGNVTDESGLAHTDTAVNVESIGTDAVGELYALGLEGQVWRLDPA
jgi:glucose/arabinose dehydrogenase